MMIFINEYTAKYVIGGMHAQINSSCVVARLHIFTCIYSLNA